MPDTTADDSANTPATPSTPADAPTGAPAVPAVVVTTRTRKRVAKKAAPADGGDAVASETPARAAKKTAAAAKTSKTAKAAKTTKAAKTAKSAKTADSGTTADAASADAASATATSEGGADPAEAAKPARKSSRKKAASSAPESAKADSGSAADGDDRPPSMAAVFQAPEVTTSAPRTAKKSSATKSAAKKTTAKKATAKKTADEAPSADAADAPVGAAGDGAAAADDSDAGGEGPARRKRRRGGRRRRKPGSAEGSGEGSDETGDDDGSADEASTAAEGAESGESASTRRRRRRRRAGEEGGDSADDPANTVTRVRSGRSAADEITAVSGSTRLEAKKQRRREGREAGRRRAPIVSEAEFLARRESVNRVMVIRQRDDVTQIGVLEDNVLVEHYVARESQTSLIGNVYLGRVQNVLPSMEAAFIDIGKGRNAVLYAGEVNWSALGHKDGQPRKIESVLSSGQTVLVQVTKDPIGHKGARLTSQISLAGRFLVYVPDGTTSGISRKLPDTERNRLKTLLREIVPEHAGVIVRTAAEGASEDELTRDVERLTSRWADIEKKAAAKGAGASLLYGEPDLTLKVVRDLFTEDFARLVIQGDDAWDTVQGYVTHVAPDLEQRLERYQPTKGQDVFSAFRIDEQIKKGLERKVWLPSGGSLVIDRTEAMTVVDVNTGKFTGSGGNLEETVTKNNLEAAEEIVRQLRLRDIGGIIVVDFIDMVLESNRDLVLRRLVECLGRDRTRHQVAEVTSLGLVQMTRKRIGTGLLESFSHDCPQCHGRGVVVEDAPVEPRKNEEEPRRARRGRSRGRGDDAGDSPAEPPKPPSPKDVAAMARHHDEHHDDDHADREDHEDHEDDTLEDLREADQEQLADSDVSAPELTMTTHDEATDTDETAAEQPAEGADDSLTLDEAERPDDDEPTVPDAPEAPEATEVPEAVAPPAEPEKPRVVTRTRRRAASRPAGPPAPVEPSGASTDADGQATEGTPALHVPVKRKGTRKR